MCKDVRILNEENTIIRCTGWVEEKNSTTLSGTLLFVCGEYQFNLARRCVFVLNVFVKYIMLCHFDCYH